MQGLRHVPQTLHHRERLQAAPRGRQESPPVEGGEHRLHLGADMAQARGVENLLQRRRGFDLCGHERDWVISWNPAQASASRSSKLLAC